MNKNQITPCPLCYSASKIHSYPIKHSSHYICPSCGELVVKSHAETWLRDKATDQIRKRYTETAMKCTEGNVSFISISSVEGTNTYSASLKYLPLKEALGQ